MAQALQFQHGPGEDHLEIVTLVVPQGDLHGVIESPEETLIKHQGVGAPHHLTTINTHRSADMEQP
jgi:hypothetical protein